MKTNKEADPNPLKPYNNRLVATKIATNNSNNYNKSNSGGRK